MENLNKERILALLKKEKNYLYEKYHLYRIGLFGSYAKETNTAGSDVDLIVEFNKPIGLDFIELGDYLEKLLNKKVDLITIEGVKSGKLDGNIENQVIYVN